MSRVLIGRRSPTRVSACVASRPGREINDFTVETDTPLHFTSRQMVVASLRMGTSVSVYTLDRDEVGAGGWRTY